MMLCMSEIASVLCEKAKEQQENNIISKHSTRKLSGIRQMNLKMPKNHNTKAF